MHAPQHPSSLLRSPAAQPRTCQQQAHCIMLGTACSRLAEGQSPVRLRMRSRLRTCSCCITTSTAAAAAASSASAPATAVQTCMTLLLPPPPPRPLSSRHSSWPPPAAHSGSPARCRQPAAWGPQPWAAAAPARCSSPGARTSHRGMRGLWAETCTVLLAAGSIHASSQSGRLAVLLLVSAVTLAWPCHCILPCAAEHGWTCATLPPQLLVHLPDPSPHRQAAPGRQCAVTQQRLQAGRQAPAPRT